MSTVRRKPNQVEKRIESGIIRNLRILGFFVSKFSQPRRTMQTAGIPDLFVAHARWKVSLWIEVKRPGGKLSAGQAVWHREARAAGQTVIVASSTDDVIAELQRMGVPIT